MKSQPEQTGIDLLRNPAKTKSTAFTPEERERYKLLGLLPANAGSMESQLKRVLTNMRRKENDIEKYISCRRCRIATSGCSTGW